MSCFLFTTISLAALFCASFGQPYNFNFTLPGYSSLYIFQREYTGNYTDSIRYCREFFNAKLIKFDSNDEYERILAIAMERGNAIIGVYIPPAGDYKNLTWVDGTPIDVNVFSSMTFRGGGLPGYSSQFRYFYIRSSSGDLGTGLWFGGCICKKAITNDTVATSTVPIIQTTSAVSTIETTTIVSSTSIVPTIETVTSTDTSNSTELQPTRANNILLSTAQSTTCTVLLTVTLTCLTPFLIRL